MSAKRVQQELVRWTMARQWPEPISTQWRNILEAALPGALELLAAISYMSHPQRKDLARQRAAVCGLLFAQANLIDDLQDGEAPYVSAAQAPCLQALGWTLFAQELLGLGLPQDVTSRVWRLAERACVGQIMEVDATAWSFSLYQEVTRRIAGDQWSLYLQILWQDTPWAQLAEGAGRTLGSLASLEIDRREGAHRWASMPQEDTTKALAWRDALVRELGDIEHLPGISFMKRWVFQDGTVTE